MSIYPTGRDKPGRASFTPEKEKPGTGPGFGNNTNSEVQYSPLPKYRPAAQLLTLLREQHAAIRDYKPLAIGIHAEVRTRYPTFSRTAVRLALQFHTHSRTYLQKLAAGSARYDLDGKPGERITTEHQQQAREKLTARRQASKPTPRGSEVTNTAPVETGDAASPDAVILRLKETRPRLTLKRKGGKP